MCVCEREREKREREVMWAKEKKIIFVSEGGEERERQKFMQKSSLCSSSSLQRKTISSLNLKKIIIVDTDKDTILFALHQPYLSLSLSLSLSVEPIHRIKVELVNWVIYKLRTHKQVTLLLVNNFIQSYVIRQSGSKWVPNSFWFVVNV